MIRTILYLLLLCCISCKLDYAQVQDMGYIDDIPFDAELDNPNFELCKSDVYQYFNNSGNIEFEGDKPIIIRYFKENYRPPNASNESGLIRIRFIVNCEGETDRFRLIAMDNNWQPKTFSKDISNQILQLTKDLKGWKSKTFNGIVNPYYQYLIFKIVNGKIVKILP